MIFLKKKKKICVDFRKYLVNIKLKYNCFFMYFCGKYKIYPISLQFISVYFDDFKFINDNSFLSNMLNSTLFNFVYFSNSKSCFRSISFDFFKIKQNLKNTWLIVNNGFMGQLYLNGLGFKSTRKESVGKKYWRFNVGHSHVFKFYPPKEIIVKVKARVLFFFCINNVQIGDTLHKLRSFHVPDTYKGVGIKFKDEFIRLKKGKTRQ